MPEKIWPGRADSWESKKRSTLAAALALTAPGIPMLFQGQEFLEWGTWSDNPANNPNAMLDWSKKQTFRGIFDLYRRLVALRRNADDNTRGLTGQHLNVFHVNHTAKVLAYHRWMLGGAGDDVVIVANLSNHAYDAYNIGLPAAARGSSASTPTGPPTTPPSRTRATTRPHPPAATRACRSAATSASAPTASSSSPNDIASAPVAAGNVLLRGPRLRLALHSRAASSSFQCSFDYLNVRNV